MPKSAHGVCGQRCRTYRNAHVNAPSCTPCRSALLSGQYFWRTGRGAILQGAVWDSSIPSYPLLLKEAGYHIGKTFKVWSPGTPADAPYGGQQYAYEQAGRRFNQFSQTATALVADGMSVEAAKQVLYDDLPLYTAKDGPIAHVGQRQVGAKFLIPQVRRVISSR